MFQEQEGQEDESAFCPDQKLQAIRGRTVEERRGGKIKKAHADGKDDENKEWEGVGIRRLVKNIRLGEVLARWY